MANPTEPLSPAKQALLELRTLRARLAEYERAASEPIAVIGTGLRFPGGAVDPAGFWQLLDQGRDGIGPIPRTRWDIDRLFDADPETPGKMYTREGGFIDGVEGFDAGFFGISPREAILMDPQQRILMEVAWEALEHAGQNAAKLNGSATGVFLGLSNSDHLRIAFQEPEIDVYTSTGTNFSVAAGRISFALGLNGPSMTVDTACSSGLVAVHLAARSLRSGECRMALAGGINLILSPEVNVCFSKGKLLAFDNRCKTFDARADGYVRSEGCGIVVLKRLSDALADGDNILALIRGCAVNQDGRSGGLTVPNGPAQEAVIRQALANAGVKPEEVDYVEAHGTGTSLGDPIEAHALASVLGNGRSKERPLVVGSVKTNVGHLESAAGIAGLIKVVLSLEKEKIPAHLHFERMNPHIDWKGVEVEIPVKGREWKRREGKRRVAGVSSFGFSGTNAHIVLEEAPVVERKERAKDRGVHVLALSARTASALETLRSKYERLPAGEIEDICYTANAGRAGLTERVVLDAETQQVMARGRAEGKPEVVFVFTGQGAQYVGMGRELYETEPVFREVMDRCAAAVEGVLKPGLLDVLYGSATGLLDDTTYTQPAGYALQVALAAQWRSWGVEPSIVLGHSVGEYAASAVAGLYTVEDGMRLITERGRLTGGLEKGQGAMAVILAPRAEVEAELGRWVSVAAYNGPENIVISGRTQEVEAICAKFTAAGKRAERLRVSHGFHSPCMAPIEEAFERFAAGIEFQEPRVTVLSTVLGRAAGVEEMGNGRYWRKQVRGSVHFDEALRKASECEVFVEIGPGSTVLGMGRELIGRDSQAWLPSIRRSNRDNRQMAESLSELWVRGVEVNWDGYYAGRGCRRVPLPTYPFEHQKYWLEPKPASTKSVDPETSWNSIREAVVRQAGLGRLDLDVSSYAKRWDWMDRLTGAYMRRTLAEVGAFQTPGEPHTVESLTSACGILPGYRKLLGRWLNRLCAEGVLGHAGEQFEAREALTAPDVEALEWEAREFFGRDRILLDYLISCGTQLTGVLTGRINALETIFPGGGFEQAEAMYEHAPLSNYFAEIARSSLESIVRTGRAGLRVLEVGAGSGATSAALVPLLAGSPGSEYWFTDVSELFLEHGERKFSAYPFVRYELLNIEQPPDETWCEPGSFDVIVATNVLHATRDLDATLRNVRSLLAPGGHMILCEVTSYLSWFDVTTGLIEGWQLFEDGWRADHPLLEAEKWLGALEAAGFERVLAVPESGAAAEVLGQHVFVVRAPGTTGESFAGVSSAAGRQTSVARDAGDDWHSKLNDAPETERIEVLLQAVRTAIARTLRMPSPESLEWRRRLVDLGLDSLMAVELRNRLGKMLQLEQPLSATLVFDYPTMEAIARHLHDEIFGQEQQALAATAVSPAASAPEMERQIADLSDEDAEALLLEKLKAFQVSS